jgi:hypothetical protein
MAPTSRSLWPEVARRGGSSPLPRRRKIPRVCLLGSLLVGSASTVAAGCPRVRKSLPLGWLGLACGGLGWLRLPSFAWIALGCELAVIRGVGRVFAGGHTEAYISD